MTDQPHLEHRLVPPDPDDAPGWPGWPAPARRRLALCALLDRIDEVVSASGSARVVLPDRMRASWRGLEAILESYGVAATVGATAGVEDAEQLTMPTDAREARRGRHGTALLGAAPAAVRFLGLTVGGAPGAVEPDGPWQVITDEGWRTTLSRAVLLDPLLVLRPGQRLQAIVDACGEPVIVSAWH